mmetsp:Transcript_40661/g.88559  ORF Transcript_40661/g.88559 Transcript_40661/m.88559 type:complete len:343 (+) Transcript_40661:201-1229(+)
MQLALRLLDLPCLHLLVLLRAELTPGGEVPVVGGVPLSKDLFVGCGAERRNAVGALGSGVFLLLYHHLLLLPLRRLLGVLRLRRRRLLHLLLRPRRLGLQHELLQQHPLPRPLWQLHPGLIYRFRDPPRLEAPEPLQGHARDLDLRVARQRLKMGVEGEGVQDPNHREEVRVERVQELAGLLSQHGGETAPQLHQLSDGCVVAGGLRGAQGLQGAGGVGVGQRGAELALVGAAGLVRLAGGDDDVLVDLVQPPMQLVHFPLKTIPKHRPRAPRQHPGPQLLIHRPQLQAELLPVGLRGLPQGLQGTRHKLRQLIHAPEVLHRLLLHRLHPGVEPRGLWDHGE